MGCPSYEVSLYNEHTDGRTNMGDYQGPRRVNLGSKIQLAMDVM